MKELLQATIDVANVVVDDNKRRLVDEPVNEDLLKKNKYANNSEYVPESVYKKILNKLTGAKWSFIPHTITSKGDDKSPYVEYIGLLIVPGYGIHTGIGTQPLNKKDNQNATAAAKTYAFKNACKEMGLAPNVGDEDWDQPVFEEEVQEAIAAKKAKAEAKKNKGKEKDKKKSSSEKPKEKGERTLEDRIQEIRDAYELDDDNEFVAFLQVWNEDILDHEDMSDSDWKKFLKYHKENKDEFKDF